MEARLLVIGSAVVGLLAVGGVVLLFRRAAAVLAGGGVVLLSRRAAVASAGGAVGRDFLGSSVLLQDRQLYMECTPLKDLSWNSYRWKVMVRVARIWEFRSSDQSTLFSLEFIVVDQQKSVMEGVVPGNRVDQFKDQLKEGSVYTIDKFDLYDPKKTYRSVDSPFRICFTMRTLLAEVVAPPENFPMFAHSALPFSVLTNRINNKIVLSDVVGLVTKVTDVLPPSGKAKSQKRLGERYKISVKITEVLSEDGWYYMSCTACWKKLTLEDGVYMCPNCSTVVPLPSHLQVQIVDPIIQASTALRQATADRTADKNDENSTVPQVPEQIETAGQASTPPPSTDLTPSKVASSGSAVDKVPSSSSGRGKRKNSGSTTSPKSKKTLKFPGND
ncbi:hypothetical protein ACQ4PT_047887 [Festuca glaucescens]